MEEGFDYSRQPPCPEYDIYIYINGLADSESTPERWQGDFITVDNANKSLANEQLVITTIAPLFKNDSDLIYPAEESQDSVWLSPETSEGKKRTREPSNDIIYPLNPVYQSYYPIRGFGTYLLIGQSGLLKLA